MELIPSEGRPLGYGNKLGGLCGDHLKALIWKQGESGAIPILFADFLKLLDYKLRKCTIADGKLDMSGSFVLQRIFAGWIGSEEEFPEFKDFPKEDRQRGLYRLTPGTTDSELLFAYGMCVACGGMNKILLLYHIKTAIGYLERNYMKDGLHHGADWRDTMEKFFRDRPLFSNNAILYSVYTMMGETEKAEALKKKIHEVLWNGETYLDYPDADRFDPLGASLGVLHDLIPREHYASVLAGFRSVDTPTCGVTIQCKHNPHKEGEAKVIEETDGVVVWPFVVGFTILAALKMGETEFALEQFAKMLSHDGFAEYYDPLDGSKWGEYEQGWSAALYVRVHHALVKQNLIAA
jgi:hypothetical protein